ncbi:MAG TPA: DUF1549 domain-containing protein, partial [Planctomycetota bacterium]|nr:DUF1549 domain-containing protein [Planctomycetota bacterium]
MLLSLSVLALALQAPESDGPVDFYGEVRPILAIHCVPCHAGEKPKGALALDRPEGLRKGGESQEPAVVPGKSAASGLLGRIQSDDPERRMPPKGPRLSPREVGILSRWIDGGAPWPLQDRYWAFQPPRRPEIPPEAHPAVDGFIRAKLKSRGLSPAPPADPRTLLRRLYLDLVGVPPTPREAQEFLGDRSPEAYARLVDRLLADPRYGERWARHWLDLVRYAESDGFENDRVRPHAWRYRDYVIRSFNSDKPYDRFVQEQIAGDEL